MEWEWLRDLAQNHRNKVIGGLGGLIFALLVMRFGLMWTVFILLCCGAGYWVGKRLDDEPESLVQLLDRIFPPGGR
ncbi:MAG TPA: DUF2273 domain-containing protein [Symbiobacteriaceae bacterium]|nr:DUF2273 domain-containing protein [Symbiobacteriaceae bacterium]